MNIFHSFYIYYKKLKFLKWINFVLEKLKINKNKYEHFKNIDGNLCQ